MSPIWVGNFKMWCFLTYSLLFSATLFRPQGVSASEDGNSTAGGNLTTAAVTTENVTALRVAHWNTTKPECEVAEHCGVRMWCENGTCICPSGYLKYNNTCNDIIGLSCTSLGQCNKYLVNSVCDMTGSHKCQCKPGFGYQKNSSAMMAPNSTKIIQLSSCAVILGSDCLGHEEYCRGVQNVECTVPNSPTSATKPTNRIFSQTCQCIKGLRPDSSVFRNYSSELYLNRMLTNLTHEVSVASALACEEVIDNTCSANLTDCSLYVDHSFCDPVTNKCVCEDSFVMDLFSRLCSNDTSTKETSKRVLLEDKSRAKIQNKIDSSCYMIYFPCDAPNSICAPHPYLPYQGYCTCAPGFVPVESTYCVPEYAMMPVVPIMPLPSVTSTTEVTPETTVATTDSTTVETTTDSVTTVTEVTTTSDTPVTSESDNTTTTTSTAETTTESVELPFSCGLPGNSKSDVFGLGSQFVKMADNWGVVQTSGNVVHNKIVGGQAALKDEICWQAGVLSFMEDFKSYEYCGGSILNPNYVLTAMHCVVAEGNVSQKTPVERMFVAVGALDFPTAAPAGSYCGKHVKVRRVIVHPEADFVMAGTEFMGITNDLALIELDETLDFSHECVCSICLLDTVPLAGEECVISGYGCQDAACQSPPPHDLSFLKVPIIAKNDSRCQHGDNRLSTDGIVCIGSTEEKDACQGDSGGPLVCWDAGRSRYYLSGATSYGYGGVGRSCAAGQLARYTDVSHYLPWIRANIQA